LTNDNLLLYYLLRLGAPAKLVINKLGFFFFF